MMNNSPTVAHTHEEAAPRKKLDEDKHELEEKVKTTMSNFKYDFPLIVNYGRIAQMASLAFQTFVIYSEWDRIGTSLFLPLLVMFAIHGANVFIRWKDSIDGRYDLKQMLTVTNPSVRLQYALAVLLSPALAITTWWFFYPEGISIFNSTLYFASSIAKAAGALGIFLLEAFEVSKEKFKKN